MKFLIVLAYCDRPNMVRFAIDSLKAQTYQDFEVAIIDDSTVAPISIALSKGIPTQNGSVYVINDTIDDKISQGGSRHGEFINKAINNSDADIVLMLCDDDALIPHTLEKLNEFYVNNPEISYSYGHVLTFNPVEAKNYGTIKGRYGSSLNSYDRPINAFCRVDSSQVSWRMDKYRDANIAFPYPMTAALDASVFQQMFDRLGACHFNKQFVQYKGIFPDQLGLRKDPYRPIDKESYD